MVAGPFRRAAFGAVVAGAMVPASAGADELGDLKQALETAKQQMQEMEAAHRRQIEALEGRVRAVEQRSNAAANAAAAQPPAHAAKDHRHGSYSIGGLDLDLGVTADLAAGGSSVPNSILSGLQAADHDPNKNGFRLKSLEWIASGTVDPYFDAQATLALQIDAEGETKLELEEAFATTRGLPYGLQAKAGMYFTEFGRANTQHSHEWAFVDQSFVATRLLGPDGLRSPGARLSWLTPLPFFSEITVGVQNSDGETVFGFLSEENEELLTPAGGGEEEEGEEGGDKRQIRNLGDLLYSARWLNGFDLSDTVSMNIGFSGAVGPNDTDANADTFLLGSDIYIKWQPVSNERGFPFVSLQAEGILREFEFRGEDGDEDLEDYGFYTQALWGFRPGWVAGLRFGYADANDQDRFNGPFRDERTRLSPNITWYPSENSLIRLQYNRDWFDFDEDAGGDEDTADTIWVQFIWSLGAHAAHGF